MAEMTPDQRLALVDGRQIAAGIHPRPTRVNRSGNTFLEVGLAFATRAAWERVRR
ncbi:MAG: hypothetical protein RSB42_06205 [Comamonas sp.]